jgi:uncharacterized membrane protein HdeD (DUF308 family)
MTNELLWGVIAAVIAFTVAGLWYLRRPLARLAFAGTVLAIVLVVLAAAFSYGSPASTRTLVPVGAPTAQP